MVAYAIAVAVSFGLAFVATSTVRRISTAQGWLARPREDRAHTTPTALFGGVAIFFGLTVGTLIFGPLAWPYPALWLLGTGIFALGLIDDLKELGPQTRLVAEIAAGVLLYLAGFHFNAALPRLLDLAIVVFWVVGITNAMNLLDNMNGLCAGTAVIALVFRFAFFVKDGNTDGAIASAVFLGAILGFLIFNFPRASIFMGDAGSLLIGFTLAALNLTSGESYSKGLFSVLFFPVVALAIPIFDTAFVSVVRMFSGRPVSQGGRDHTSHRLVAVGLSETAAVLVLHGISLVSGTIAFVFYQIGFSYAWFLAALLVLGFVLFGVFLAHVKVYPEDQVPQQDGSTGRFSLISNFTYKRVVLWILVDTLTCLVAWYLAFLIRYGQTTAWDREVSRFAETAPIAIVGMLVGLYLRGLYRTDWQHLSLHELRTIASGTLVGLGIAVAVLAIAGNDVATRWVLVALAVGVHVLLLSSTRLFVRTLADLPRSRQASTERVLIYGAGKGGELALRELRNNSQLGKTAVGFIDDDPARRGMTLHGVPVVGGLDAVSSAVRENQVEGILISTRKLRPARERQLVTAAREVGLHLYRLDIAIVPFAAPLAPEVEAMPGPLRAVTETGARRGARHE